MEERPLDAATREYEGLRPGQDLFDDEAFRVEREHDDADRERLKHNVQSISGFVRCGCGSMDTSSYPKQTSGGDEQTNWIHTCQTCKARWS